MANQGKLDLDVKIVAGTPSDASVSGADPAVLRIAHALRQEARLEDAKLTQEYADRMKIRPELSRQLVSFQANKVRPNYRWYKFKEAFSAGLVEYLLRESGVHAGVVLDPFAGSGTTLFAAAEMGLDTEGIELLPIGQEIIATRLSLETALAPNDLARLRYWARRLPWRQVGAEQSPLLELKITRGAYPPETLTGIEQYVAAANRENEKVRAALRFALLCVLESVSYTRKDGQYLRWDYRSGRRQGAKRFDKGTILQFDHAIRQKLEEITTDTGLMNSVMLPYGETPVKGAVTLHRGSCLKVLPTLRADSYSAVFTSPPYCNRYDYTRTYALELALLGVDEAGVAALRQDMLSCTVESRGKDLLNMNPGWKHALHAAEKEHALQAILRYLQYEREAGLLNNNGIPRMVRGYFYEMACVISECYRVLQPGAPLLMVNDNVRYAGVGVSVDLILSAIAEAVGFDVEHIMVLPTGKGNSSQQMGEHGREVLRKCVYIWRKPREPR